MSEVSVRPAFDLGTVVASALLTPEQAGKELGISRRGVYRCVERAEAAGKTVRVQIGSTRFITREALPIIKSYYYDPKDLSLAAVTRRQEWGKQASDASPKRGRPRSPRPEAEAGFTISDIKRVRRFVERMGSVEAAEAAVREVARVQAAPDRGNE